VCSNGNGVQSESQIIVLKNLEHSIPELGSVLDLIGILRDAVGFERLGRSAMFRQGVYLGFLGRCENLDGMMF
jgi:hypothetical protein